MKKLKNDENYSYITKIIKRYEYRFYNASNELEKEVVLKDYLESINLKAFYFCKEDFTLFANILEDINIIRMILSFNKLKKKFTKPKQSKRLKEIKKLKKKYTRTIKKDNNHIYTEVRNYKKLHNELERMKGE